MKTSWKPQFKSPIKPHNRWFFNIIGTGKANLAFYQGGKYKPIKVDEPVAIVVCTDNVSIKGKEPFVHAHMAVSNKKGEVIGVYVM